MLLKAGTYRFNDVIMPSSIEPSATALIDVVPQYFNFNAHLSDGSERVSLTKIGIGCIEGEDTNIITSIEYIVEVPMDGNIKEVSALVYHVLFISEDKASGWNLDEETEQNKAAVQTLTIPTQEVDDTFGTWYKANTDYDAVNGITITWDGQIEGRESITSVLPNGAIEGEGGYLIAEIEVPDVNLFIGSTFEMYANTSEGYKISSIKSPITEVNELLDGIVHFGIYSVVYADGYEYTNEEDGIGAFIYAEKGEYTVKDGDVLLGTLIVPKTGIYADHVAFSGEKPNIVPNIYPSKLTIPALPTKTKKFTRLYLGEVAYSSNGKRFRKLQTEEPTIRLLSATLPAALGAMGSGTVGENIYLFGGLNDRYYPANTIYKFDTKTNSLTTPSATLPYTLYGVACGVVGANIYLFGGNSNNDGKKIHKYDTTTNTITTLSAKMPKGLPYMACGVVGTNVYLFGGRGDDDVNTIYKFDTTTNTLTQLSTTLPDVMGGSGCGVVGANIYLFGGYNDLGAKNTIYKFDTTTDTLTTLNATLPNNYGSMKCGVIDTDVYLIGGAVWGNEVNTIYKYDTIADTLEELTTTLPVVLSSMACGVVETGIYLFGGNGDNGCVNTIYKYKAI